MTRREISKLKVSLEEAQLHRKRKIEYDQVAEKVNILPSRADLHRYACDFSIDGKMTYELSLVQLHPFRKKLLPYRWSESIRAG